MSKQMVRRWCRTFSDGRQQVEDIPRAGRTRTATTDANVGKVDDMIRANRRITIDEVAEELGISHERAQNIIHDILRYRKVSVFPSAASCELCASEVLSIPRAKAKSIRTFNSARDWYTGNRRTLTA
ncbi:histone-lysine N-methyltransferase SETMAR [Trichonephila inaurata madagascariensis]|uniref:Histone-lysine N-methyltransferase SETMAR n=1 Tax=Trichonephila inaurata madagascariensis TaxID=2747483 RepID=A0A8X6X6B0_9ARAC|nr:histone-lysine N-methyltransferase SETMAR [Trichonephila inaurata madagascariensis]